MPPAPAKHPHAYTLGLLRLAIDLLPPTFSAARRQEYEKRLANFWAMPQTGYDEIIRSIVALGKESWPHRQSYEEIYRRYGRASEEAHLLEHLDAGVRDKYERFIHEGGKINHIESATSAEGIWQASPFERYFTPEEKFAIQQALLAAREEARQEINGLVADGRRAEYNGLVDEHTAKQQVIERRLEDLRSLAKVNPRFAPDIQDRVRTLEEGWSVVERGINEERLEKEIEYWRGALEAFLYA